MSSGRGNSRSASRSCLRETSLGGVYGLLCGIMFYRDIAITAFMMMFFAAIGYIKGRKQEAKENSETDESHFYEFLIELSEGLDTGNNIVNTIREVQKDIPRGRVKNRLGEVIARLGLNYSLDEVFERFSGYFTSGLIKNWSRIIMLSYKNGAELQKAIRENRDLFILKRRTRLEVNAILAKQRFNFMIIKFMPFVIMLILVSSSGEFIKALYDGTGRIVMSAALVLIVASEWIAEKISEI
jgi:tight adherence protein B